MNELIHLKHASKSYHVGDIEIPAVRDVSLEIKPGEFIAVTGASGSGKSTMMHLLGCLDQLDSGVYTFEGRHVEKLSRLELAKLRNQRIGFVFQSFNLLPRTSIVYNVALPLVYQGVRRRERMRRATAMLEHIGLGDRLRHQPSQLSGGQQQRVAIARALVTQPAVLLADEPTGNLDSKTSADVMQILQSLNEEEGVCIVLVTHERNIAGYADREVTFQDGCIVEDVDNAVVAGV